MKFMILYPWLKVFSPMKQIAAFSQLRFETQKLYIFLTRMHSIWNQCKKTPQINNMKTLIIST